MKKLANFGEKKWEPVIEMATRAYNVSFHRAINTSPYKLKYGEEPILEIASGDKVEISKAELMEQRDTHFENYKRGISKGKNTHLITLK
ncbi:hypothetical protein GINT2_001898 [Glugoides intestinalis]